MDNLDFSKIYSYSRLKLFEQCPKAYEFSYLDPIYKQMKTKLKKETENIWAFNTLGKAVHNAITLFFYLAKEKQNLKNLKEQLKFAWRSEAMPRKKPPLGKWGGFKNLEEERGYYQQALAMLLNFYRLFKKEALISYLPTKDLERSIDDFKKLAQPLGEDIYISGKFDLILKEENKGLQIVDFKTSKNEDEDVFQLKFYKLLAVLNFKKEVDGASFYFLKTGRVKNFLLQKESAEQIKKEIEEKIKKIKETEEFKTKPSSLCRYCLYRNFCPEKKEISQYLQKGLEDDFIDDLPF